MQTLRLVPALALLTGLLGILFGALPAPKAYAADTACAPSHTARFCETTGTVACPGPHGAAMQVPARGEFKLAGMYKTDRTAALAAFVPAPDSSSPAASPGDTGPTAIVGDAGSANSFISARLFPDPTAALVDASNLIQRTPEQFVPESGQILGILTKPLFPLPGKVRINLPVEPTAAYIDVDNNGSTDKGVQVWYLIVSSNIIGDSYLQQLEQVGGLVSFMQDTESGELEQGTFLVYAPEPGQGFPSGPGADGKWFTGDDPTAPLEQGYTVVTLGSDGVVTLDRSNPGTINTIERAEAASPDFSAQGILASFNSLIDHLKKRYAYTELRNLDWEAIRARYLPDVSRADADGDLIKFYGTLDDLALSLLDAHVSVGTTDAAARAATLQKKNELTLGNIGATVIGVSDPDQPEQAPGSRFVVLDVSENTPAQAAGWVPGTEIVTIDGKDPQERFAEIPLPGPVGTREALALSKGKLLLHFPVSRTVEIGYRLPGSQEVKTVQMVAGEYPSTAPKPPEQDQQPISFAHVNGYTVIRWNNFDQNILAKINVLEMALEMNKGTPGIILDLRGNRGGWVELMDTMSSYFFTADNPFSTNLTDWYDYDDAVGDFVLRQEVDRKLSSPRPDAVYTGPLVILVDAQCASACEYFSQHMQQMKRALVIGQYTTEGAGGPVDRIKMPGGTIFQYTVGRTTFAGTGELNLEGKGVKLDVRVPVTLESEQAKQRGEDPVMDAAVRVLQETSGPAASLAATPWQWYGYLDANKSLVGVIDPANYTLTFSADGTLSVQADCNHVTGNFALSGESMTITLGPTTLMGCAGGSQSETFLKYLAAARGFAFDEHTLAILLSPDSGAFAIVLSHPR